MTMAPDLSFRGAKRRGNLKQAVTNPPGPSYDAAVYREIAPQGHFPALRAQGATAPAEPRNDKLGSAFFPCHCEEGASPTWQSQAGSDESAGGFPVFRPVLRDCRALLRKARNDKSGSLSLNVQKAPRVRRSDCRKSLAEFAPAGAKKMEIIFSGGVYVGENTARLANVRRVRPSCAAASRSLFKREPSETGLV